MNHPNDAVPLMTVAFELGLTADELAQRFGDDVTLDNAGIRCIPTETARAFITGHRAAQQAERDQAIARRAEAAARPFPLRELVKARQAEAAQYNGDPSAPAVAIALAKDPGSAWNVASRNLDEMMTQTTVHRIRQPGRDR